MIKVRNNYTGNKSIDIDLSPKVTISLRDEQYDQLVEALDASMAEKIKESDKYQARVEKRSKACRDFIEEIRDVFYDMEVPGFGLKRCLKEIDSDKLDELLDKHSKLLGFE